VKSNLEDQTRKMQPIDANAGDHPGTADQKPRGASAGGTAPREIGGREGPEPTRYGDWELRGRCIDF
jgi:hypothetical protein